MNKSNRDLESKYRRRFNLAALVGTLCFPLLWVVIFFGDASAVFRCPVLKGDLVLGLLCIVAGVYAYIKVKGVGKPKKGVDKRKKSYLL